MLIPCLDPLLTFARCTPGADLTPSLVPDPTMTLGLPLPGVYPVLIDPLSRPGPHDVPRLDSLLTFAR
jgi:hypothetical protein